MPVKVIDLLAFDFTIVGVELLNRDQEISEFGDTVDELTVSSIRLPDGTVGTGKRLRIDKNRIYIDLTPGRSRVRQEYPSEADIPTLSELTYRAIQHTRRPLDTARAHGYNIELTYDQDTGPSAFSYIAQRVFNKDTAISDWRLVGANGTMRFEDSDGTTRNITIEPRFRDESSQRLFLSFNLHMDLPNIPEVSEIRSRFTQALRESRAFLERIDTVT